MLNRRHMILATCASIATLGANGVAVANDNPMPQELRDALERQPFTPVLGNPNGDITLSEFFDYNCPFCKDIPPLLEALINEDKNLRVVLREWPVLRPDSEIVAKISLASLKQGKYWQFHHRMMENKGPATEVPAMRIARDIGLDMVQLSRDMESQEVKDHIFQSLDLGDHMGLAGTPTFIAGNDALFGKQSLESLRSLIKTAREQLL